MKRYVFAAWILAAACVNSPGSGMLIPKDQDVPPLAIEHQRVDIQIKDGVATARIEQVFKNSVDRNLEAVYVFPLPENASISDFAMYINGKRVSGELVEKDKARRTYEDIVRRLKDPGLLEHLGGNLFRVSVFPVPANGLQKIELEYSQTLTYEGGLYEYAYPLKTGEKASRTLADFTVAVRVTSKVPIKTFYSPSHKVGITRKGEGEAVIGFEEDKALLDRDFVLYYGVSKKDFGLNLLTHAVKGDKGFFMMMLAPSVLTEESAAMPKDVTFVFDSSGSMAGDKIEQARKALQYCVNTLNDGDRFNIIRFSTDVDLFNDKLVEASKDNRQKALAFIQKIEARGGTAIDAALQSALGLGYDAKRPATILFLTDGKPTVGETSVDAILAGVAKANNRQARVFVFGVDEQVNTLLLDKLSSQNGGVSQYVLPNEDIEVKVSNLVGKMSHPVLTKVKVEVDKIKTLMMHPSALPDLFSGDQLTVFGRYDGEGDYAIRLVGEVNGKKREFTYEGTFPAANADNGFIPRLWATRRVGYLLDEIRLHGEAKELKDEVIHLSKDYGIMTPYTSYLVLEDDQAYQRAGIERGGGSSAAPAPKPAEVFAQTATRTESEARERRNAPGVAAPASAPVAEEPARSMVPMFDAAPADKVEAQGFGVGYGLPAKQARVFSGSEKQVNDYMKKDSGMDAIALSKAIQQYKERSQSREDITTVRHVGAKVFYLIDGRWVDRDFREGLKTVTVKFGSDEYFRRIADNPDLKGWLSIGEKITVVLADGTALVVE